MYIEQFFDKELAHASYAVLSENEVALVDPARDPKPYLDFAAKNDAKIIAVIETHPHADFVSCHMEIREITGAKILVSELVGADYPHQSFDEGDELDLGNVKLKALNTPGHSPDSISILLIDEEGKNNAVFTGDTLFIGDVGRPDLREKAGKLTAKREELARKMYHSTRNILAKLEEDVLVYPAHGAGSLCGKNLSSELSSTIGREYKENYALQNMSEDAFVKLLLEDQPFIPKYFPHDVAVNKAGAAGFETSVAAVPRLAPDEKLQKGVTIVDVRHQKEFKKGHIAGSINIMEEGKFETWLGSIIKPDEPYYLVAGNDDTLERAIRRAAKIGYEGKIKGALTISSTTIKSDELDVDHFIQNPDEYTIVDIRNESEIKQGKLFEGALHIPLHELRERLQEIPINKPIVVHCAGGYRSSAGASILEAYNPGVKVYDLSEKVKDFNTANV